MSETDAVDWRSFALTLCSLLDEIEQAADGIVSDSDDELLVRQLLRSRFAIAEKHGMIVEIVGAAQSGTA